MYLCAMKFAVIGSGNVAWHYSKMLIHAGLTLVKAHARNDEKWADCYSVFSHVKRCSLEDIHTDVDFILVAVTDHQIVEVANQIHPSAVIVHPSGATDVSGIIQENYGVIWGIYSFVKNQEVDYSKIPFCIEGSNAHTHQIIENVMKNVSAMVYTTRLSQRQQAHVAAVFSNNFITLLLQESFDLLQAADLPTHLIQPTLMQLISGVQHQAPDALQTGPAKRGDHATLQLHLDILSHSPAWKSTYLHLSNVLLKKYGHREL